MRFYRRNLTHIQRDFTAHFVTFVTKRRWILPPSARDVVLNSCLHDHRRKFELYVVVVMPDHVHMVLTPLIDEQRQEIRSLVRIMQEIKSASAHLVNRRLSREGTVWQEESFDHILRSSENIDAKVGYVLGNPVRKGLVAKWRDYKWTWQRQDEPMAEMKITSSQKM